ncbi:MAG: glycosyltransferase family 9 protein [Candidatus Binataceae bacterium]
MNIIHDSAANEIFSAQARTDASAAHRLWARAQARIAISFKAAANLILAAMRRCLWPRARRENINRVCIYRIGNIGDIACAIPAMRTIRRAFPRARIVLVTSPGRAGMPGARELLAGVGWIDEIVTYHAEEIASLRAQLRWIAAMRARKFDAWIDLSAQSAPLRILMRNMIAARLAGARWGCGWDYDRMRMFARAQSEVIEFPNEVARLSELMTAQGFSASDVREFPIELGLAESRAVDELLASAGPARQPFAVLAPGAKAPANRWPAGNFAAVGKHLAELGFRIAIIGAQSERELCAAIADAIGPGALNFAGRTSIRQLCEVLRRAAVAICNDSGVQHLAAAVATPCVSIFAAREFPNIWFPAAERGIVLRKWVPCHTCFLTECPYDNRCVKLITPAEALGAAVKLLSLPDASGELAARVGTSAA